MESTYVSTACRFESRAFVRVLAAMAGTLVIFMLAVGTVSPQHEQVTEGTGEMIANRTKMALIDSVSRALNDVYVFPEVAKEMEKKIRRNLKQGQYRDITTYEEFTRRLTKDLLEVSEDKHIAVWYTPEAVQLYAPPDLTEEQEQEVINQLAYDNFGFRNLERLTGNVGYVDVREFVDARYGGRTAVAAMNFLGNCDAVIFDLRNNIGGEPSMVQLISSFFFDEPVHLNSFYIRREDRMQQFWSQAYVEGPKMTDVDLYVITSPNTFSAAEEFTYNLKNLQRATVIGETTRGGAHPVDVVGWPTLKVGMSLPYGRAVNPVSGTDWEGTGIEPHIRVPSEKALEIAHLEALKKLKDEATDDARRQDLQWDIEMLRARTDPFDLDDETMMSYVGKYGPRTISYEDGQLYYRRGQGPRLRMIPMSQDIFIFEENDLFRLKIETDNGKPAALVGIYRMGRTDRTPRTDE